MSKRKTESQIVAILKEADMPTYSEERKQAVIAKMPPHNHTAAELIRSEGISLQTLYN